MAFSHLSGNPKNLEPEKGHEGPQVYTVAIPAILPVGKGGELASSPQFRV